MSESDTERTEHALRQRGKLALRKQMRAVEEEAVASGGHCNACFSGNYPIELGEFWRDRDKLAFQSAWSETGESP